MNLRQAKSGMGRLYHISSSKTLENTREAIAIAKLRMQVCLEQLRSAFLMLRGCFQLAFRAVAENCSHNSHVAKYFTRLGS